MSMIKKWWIRLLVFYGTCLKHPGHWRIHAKLLKWTKVTVKGEHNIDRAGLSFILNPSDYVQADVFWLGTKDKWDIYHILKMARPGWTVLDGGANFGYYSLKIAHYLTKDCSIFSFEPCPLTFSKLTKHIQLNNMASCITPVSAGLSKVQGTGTIDANSGNSGANHISLVDGDIPLTTIDLFCQDNALGKVDFIKLDIEGFELLALKGGKNLIQHCHPILFIEVNPRTLERMKTPQKELVEFLRSFGYNLFEVKRRRLIPFTHLPPLGELTNIFCIPGNGDVHCV